jgi:hypothetical protein
MNAPMPSPAATSQQASQYFPSSYTTQPPTSHPAQHQQQQRSQQHYGSSPSAYMGQRTGSAGVPTTASFLQDFNLVAEAAKRAQMACLSRDLGEIGL